MAGRTTLPTWFVEAGFRLGLRGKRVRWPVAGAHQGHPEAVRWLLRRAEDRVLEVLDGRPVVVRSAWGKVREVAREIGVALATTHQAMDEAEAELSRWWREGEQARVRRVQRLPQPEVALREYRMTRKALRGARTPGEARRAVAKVRPEIGRLAALSAADSWWWHAEERRGAWVPAALMEELGALVVMAVAGAVKTPELVTQSLAVLGAGGVPEAAALEVTKGIEAGCQRGVLEVRRAAG